MTSGATGSAGYADPIDVERSGASPTSFHWRGRVYRVVGVLAHWVETGPMWQSASVRGLLAAGEPEWAGVTAAPRDAGEREFWQVEAARPRQQLPGVYELCVDWSEGAPGHWSVTTAGAAAPADRGRGDDPSGGGAP